MTNGTMICLMYTYAPGCLRRESLKVIEIIGESKKMILRAEKVQKSG
jgi:hypothetical protein